MKIAPMAMHSILSPLALIQVPIRVLISAVAMGLAVHPLSGVLATIGPHLGAVAVFQSTSPITGIVCPILDAPLRDLAHDIAEVGGDIVVARANS